MKEFWNSQESEMQFFYHGDDLGCRYKENETTLKVWAPTASKVAVNLYNQGDGESLYLTKEMEQGERGIWKITLCGDYHGSYYTYLVTVDGQTKEAVDPYAKATGLNGKRAMILDMNRTNPEGFLEEIRPSFSSFTDAIIYELHIRDISMEQDSGIRDKGKFLGLTEVNTRNGDGLSTGLTHIKELGVTHLHLLPCFDFASVDETDATKFNWGYDPENYNVVEGSYATNPYDGAIRIKEFKSLIKTLHENGLRVIMDVVYNHTMKTNDSNWNKIVPDYYYRKIDGKFSDASACGNETASERLMVRKFMVDSVVYWAKEYHIDGFRFDLMGIHDIETMNDIRKELDKIDDSILLYGEGWIGGETPFPESKRAMKANISHMPGIAAFSDDIRDGLKGSVFVSEEKGYATGDFSKRDSVMFGIVAATLHPQISYSKVNYSSAPWALEPNQCVNYVSAHDNYTLWDKIACSCPDDSVEKRIKKNKLCAAIVLTSQGIPFFQAGEEMLRSKPSNELEGGFVENSYQSPDEVNCIKWSNKRNVLDVLAYYQGLIRFRKSHKALRLTTSEEIARRLIFLSGNKEEVISYMILGEETTEGKTTEEKTTEEKTTEEKTIVVLFNAGDYETLITLPESDWDVYINENVALDQPVDEVKGNQVVVKPISCMVLVKK